MGEFQAYSERGTEYEGSMMVGDMDTRDRVIRLETQVAHLTSVIEKQDEKIDLLLDTFQQAKGARYVLMALVAVGGFMAGKLPAMLSWIGMAKG